MPGRLARTRPQPLATPSPAAPATSSLGTNAPANASQTGGTNVTGSATAATPPKFTRQQIAGRLRQLRLLYEDGLLTDEFYETKVAECEAGQ